MKKKLGILLCMTGIILSGCSKLNEKDDVIERESVVVEVQENKKEKSSKETLDESIFIGEYNDYDNDEPNLEIAKGENGTYIVQIGIFRLTTLEDGVGELTDEGMEFTATDAAGNPISGIITVKDEIATVTFTRSTWGLLENGSEYKYKKSSDVPNIWE